MVAQSCQLSVGQHRAKPPMAVGQSMGLAGHGAPTLTKSPEESSMGRWETQRHRRPITAPILGPGPVAPQPAWAAFSIPAHPEVGTRWGVHLPPHPPLPSAVAGGGVVTHWRDADYLFSSDAAHPDTRRWAVLCPPAVSSMCHPPVGSTLLAWELPAALFHAHVEPPPST